MTCALHKNILDNSSIKYAIVGRFVDTSSFFLNDKPQQTIDQFDFKILDMENNGEKSQQILAIKNDRLEIYDIIHQSCLLKNDDSERNFTHRFILDYKVYGNIVTAEKIPTKKYRLDIIVLLIDYAKLVFLYYDKKYFNFKIVCMYNFEIDLPPLSYGKNYLENSKNNLFINLIYSKTYETLILSCYEKNLIIFKLKSFLNHEKNIEDIFNNNNQITSNNNTIEENTINSSSNFLNKHLSFNLQDREEQKLLDLDYEKEEKISENSTFEDLNCNSNLGNIRESLNMNRENILVKSSSKKNFEKNIGNYSNNKSGGIQAKKNSQDVNINFSNSKHSEYVDNYIESFDGELLFEPSIIIDLGGLNYDMSNITLGQVNLKNQANINNNATLATPSRLNNKKINESGNRENLLNINSQSTNANITMNTNSKFYTGNNSFGSNPNVKRIIKFQPFNKDNEFLDFQNLIKCENPAENIQLLVLYEEYNNQQQQQLETANISQNNNLFFISKINLAYVSINKLTRNLDCLDIIFEGLNPNSYDLLWISRKKCAIIFSAYMIQFITFSSSECINIYNICLNTLELSQNKFYYSNLENVFTIKQAVNPATNTSMFQSYLKKNIFEDKNFANLNIDLRGGATFVISDNQLIFTSSNGGLFVFTILEEINQAQNQNFYFQNNFNMNSMSNSQDYNLVINYSFKIEQIKIKEKNDILSFIGSPYNTLLLPHKEVFFLSSLFSDAILINFQGSKYTVTDRIINLAPIHHFNCYFDRNHTKYFMTHGYDRETYMTFLYKNFFFEYSKVIPIEDINYLKAVNFFPEKYTQFIVAHFKRGEILIYEIKNNSEMNNISDKINFYGSTLHKANSNLGSLDNKPQGFKVEIKFIKCEMLTLINYEKYLNKNPEINIVMSSINKFGNMNNSNSHLSHSQGQGKTINSNFLFNEYIFLIFDSVIQIFNRQFLLILTIRLDDIILSSMANRSETDLKYYLDNRIKQQEGDKEFIKDAYSYYDHLIIYSNKANIFIVKFGFLNQFDVEHNIQEMNEFNKNSNFAILPYKYSKNFDFNETREIHIKNNMLIASLLSINKEIIFYVNINKKIIENSVSLESSYSYIFDNINILDDEIITDLNLIKQLDNVLYFKTYDITNIISKQNRIPMEVDDLNNSPNIHNGEIITNIYINSINFNSKISYKNELEKTLSQINKSNYNSNSAYILQNQGFIPNNQYLGNFCNYNNNSAHNTLLLKVGQAKNQAIRKHLNLFLTIYKENNKLEIYQIKLADYHLNFETNLKKIFVSNNISEVPCILSDLQIARNKNDYNRASSDLTFEVNMSCISQQNINQSMPEQIFLDFLNEKLVLAIIFKNGLLVFYEACFIYNSPLPDKLYNDNNINNNETTSYSQTNMELKFIKIHTDFLENIDYRDFFYNEKQNFFIRFDNIGNNPGLLFNLKGHQKILFEIHGKLKIIDIENNYLIKRNINSFTEFCLKDTNENGFIFHENGFNNISLKICKIPKNYSITRYGILRRNKIKRFVTHNNIQISRAANINNYYIINVEKEMKQTLFNDASPSVSNLINSPNTNTTFLNTPQGNIIKNTNENNNYSLIVNKNFYFLTLRTEDVEKIDELEFPANNVISEAKIIDLYDANIKQTVQLIALGVNVLDEKGEDGIIKSFIQFYNILKGKFIKVYEKEISKNIITMLYSIDGSVIIGEGSRINIYEYSPLKDIKLISYIENKNIPVCSKTKHKFIITGDLMQSVTWIHFRQDQMHRDRPYMYIKGIDYNDYNSTALEFWIDDSEESSKNGCLLADRNKNLHIFLIESDQNKNIYSNPNSFVSTKLTEFADIHLGKVITEIKYYSYDERKSANFYSADDGSIGYIKPISKETYNSLFMLCEFIYNHLPFKAGLNPKLFFSCKYSNKREKSNILDMDILKIYIDLPLTMQKIIAKNITLKRESLIQLINQINDF